ncbi:YncE family protein [Dyadobacter alkalitolerans]|uniref:YncE family protein n=1 Tax=Dyadobacter alkalitolerans TaxID=492736 RepID=UPI00047AA8DD|nr:DUF5074 domain-containing protein [Dyadobacter alkalitolerans]
MKKQLFRLASLTSLSLFAWSCNQSDPAPKGDYIQGVFVVNEGNFSQNNGAISFFTREQTTAEIDIFNTANGTTLKGGVQDYVALDATGIILVDNMSAGQDKVEIVNSNTFQRIATIGAPEIENPREVVFGSNNKAYVSCWGTNADFKFTTGYVAVVDLVTNKVVDQIEITSGGPENLVLNNGKLFVGTVSYGGGTTLTVINTTTNAIDKSIAFENAPNPIGIDADGKLWVNDGIKVIKMNPDSYNVDATLSLGSDATKSASNFAFSPDKRTVFFVLSYFDAAGEHGGTYKFGISDAQVNVTTPLIKRIFTGLAVDPTQGLLYAGVTPSFAQAGYALRYRADGSLVDSVKVNVAPTGFFFK